MRDIHNAAMSLTRRTLFSNTGYAGAGLVFTTLLGGCEAVLDQIANRPVRRRLRTGSAQVDQDIAVYKDAVTKMKALPASNPRSWAAQSAIHGTIGGGFNFCQHGTAHFFSWHRAYLVYFEQICRELTGVKTFGLPYWNWNQNPALHPEFTNAGSSLFHPRNNTTVAGNPAFSNATLSTIFGDDNFFTFSSQIEGTPHNTAHVVIGANMATGGSPLDPIFWAHHCMVDYCWAKWNIELNNDNTNDSTWINTSWNHFVDGKGNQASATAGITILMPLLSYRYETSPIGTFPAGLSLEAINVRDLQRVEERLRRGADVRIDIRRRVPIAAGARIPLTRPFSTQTRLAPADINALIDSDQRAERVFVRVNYAELPADGDFFVRVFINRPNANAQTPVDDPHFAGSFAFFGTHTAGHGDHQTKKEFLVNVTETLQNLRRQNRLNASTPLSVQLVAVPAARQFTRAATALNLEAIEFIVTPVTIARR